MYDFIRSFKRQKLAFLLNLGSWESASLLLNTDMNLHDTKTPRYVLLI